MRHLVGTMANQLAALIKQAEDHMSSACFFFSSQFHDSSGNPILCACDELFQRDVILLTPVSYPQ